MISPRIASKVLSNALILMQSDVRTDEDLGADTDDLSALLRPLIFDIPEKGTEFYWKYIGCAVREGCGWGW